MSDVKVDPGTGYRLLEDGEIKPEGYEALHPDTNTWERGCSVGSRWASSMMTPCRIKLPEPPAPKSLSLGGILDEAEAKPSDSTHPDKNMYIGEADLIQKSLDCLKASRTPDPKTKYIRDIYPVDSEVHEDANGKQFVRIDVYSVLRAFGVDHPTGHAVKKLLCAGLRGKGDRIQDLTEAKVAIDRAIQEAGI